MDKVRIGVGDYKKRYIIGAGLLLILLYHVPYFMAGPDGVYRIHDYLEQDYVYCLLNRKYLFTDLGVKVQELFDGADKCSIQSHSLIQVLLTYVFHEEALLIANMILDSAVGFIGMFLLIEKIDEDVVWGLNLCCSLTFALGVTLMHGMTVKVVPFFIYFCILLWDNQVKYKIIISVCLFLIGLGSSLIYGGFLLCLILLILNLIKTYKKKSVGLGWIGLTCLVLGYSITYFNTIVSVLSGFPSHREEFTIFPEGFWKIFYQYLIDGYGETAPFLNGKLVMGLILGVGVIKCIAYRNIKCKYIHTIIVMSAITVGVCFFSTIYKKMVFVDNFIFPFLKQVQINRAIFILPTLWYIIVYFSFRQILEWFTRYDQFLVVCVVVVFVVLLMRGGQNGYYKGTIKVVLSKKFNIQIGSPVSSIATYKGYFDRKLMKEVKEYIDRPQDEYKVVSLGINPGVALFNGFFCLDGYSVNYSINYKHKFRKIIESELEKNLAHKEYFDGWGSRCYLISSEIEFGSDCQGQKCVNKLEISTKGLKQMGCEYILSGVEIENQNEIGLRCEKVFQSRESERIVRLYKIVL